MARNPKHLSKFALALAKAGSAYIHPDLLFNPSAPPRIDSFIPATMDPERVSDVRSVMREERAKALLARAEATGSLVDSARPAASRPEFKACYIIAGSRSNTGTTEPAATAPASGAGGPSAAPAGGRKNAFQLLSEEIAAKGIRVTPIQGVGSYPSAAAEAKAKKASIEHVDSGAGYIDVAELGGSGEQVAAMLRDPEKLMDHLVSGITGLGETGLAERRTEIVAAVKKDVAEGRIKAGDPIELIGHSRGAVAALEAAHILSKDPATKDLRLTLVLNDPVAGPGHNKFEHFFLPDNVDHCDYYHALETRMPGFANISLSGDRVTHILVPDVHSGMIRGEGTSVLPGDISRDFFVADVLHKNHGDEYAETATHTAAAMQEHFDEAARKHRKSFGDGSGDDPVVEVDPYDDSITKTKRGYERARAYDGGFSSGKFARKSGGVEAPFSGAAFASKAIKRVTKGTGAAKSDKPGLV